MPYHAVSYGIIPYHEIIFYIMTSHTGFCPFRSELCNKHLHLDFTITFRLLKSIPLVCVYREMIVNEVVWQREEQTKGINWFGRCMLTRVIGVMSWWLSSAKNFCPIHPYGRQICTYSSDLYLGLGLTWVIKGVIAVHVYQLSSFGVSGWSYRSRNSQGYS